MTGLSLSTVLTMINMKGNSQSHHTPLTLIITTPRKYLYQENTFTDLITDGKFFDKLNTPNKDRARREEAMPPNTPSSSTPRISSK